MINVKLIYLLNNLKVKNVFKYLYNREYGYGGGSQCTAEEAGSHRMNKILRPIEYNLGPESKVFVCRWLDDKKVLVGTASNHVNQFAFVK